MFEIRIKKSLQELGVKERPNAKSGIWLSFLLPLAILISAIKHSQETSKTFKNAAILCMGLSLTSLIFIVQCIRKKDMSKATSLLLLPGTTTAFVFYAFFQRGYMLSIASGLLSGIGYYKLLLFVLKQVPYSFTLGEAGIVTQAFILFIYSTIDNIKVAIQVVPYKLLDVATLIIQVGLLAICMICTLTYFFKLCRKPFPFYIMSSTIIVCVLIIPLHILLQHSPLILIFNMLFDDENTMKLVAYWILCIVSAIFALNRQISGAKKASTAVRKIFHLLAVAAFLPGLMYECTLLYLTSGVIFGLFCTLELLRLLNMPPLGQALQDGFIVFCDDKDAGTVALTPIYLLVGCALPIWIHPAPCDITDSAGFYLLPLLSGLLSIGVGDTSASIFGSWYGNHQWPGSKKTVEGTLACIFSQVCVIFALLYFGLIVRGHQLLIKSGIAIIAGSLIEAKTTQIDNLVLPLVVYIILIL